jgi:hypothetical protein
MSMEIILADKNAYFAPGQAIDGDLVWNFPKAPRWLELRLFWYTEGKGTQDVSVVARQRMDHPSANGKQSFHFSAPHHPPSCSGSLVTIRWALELVSQDRQPPPIVQLVIAPHAREIILRKAD